VYKQKPEGDSPKFEIPRPSGRVMAISGLVVLAVIFIVVYLIGISRIHTWYSTWRASTYGANWLVIERANNGAVLNYWELRKTTIMSEKGSDGIFFPDKDGLMVHLSGKYIYIEVNGKPAQMKARWALARRKYLHPRIKKGKR